MIAKPTFISLVVISTAVLSGCGSVLNTAGSGEYGCPGMPNGVICKTPAAVYKSTHLDPVPTPFDTPIGQTMTQASSSSAVNAPLTDQSAAKTTSGPRPVREPAKVARIWIAPWVDKQDNLHLAQIHYTEVKPRTWTVGKPEVASGGGYVIPHRAYEKIPATPEPKVDSGEVSRAQPASPESAREAANLAVPPN